MTFALTAIFTSVASFLLGSIPFGLLLGWTKGVDVRKVGSGNVGAMNVGRTLGWWAFVVVFLLDLLKGFLPILLTGHYLIRGDAAGQVSPTTADLVWLGIGLCAILGHNYSPFVGFKGGKGVSTSLGVTLGIYPDFTIPALSSFICWVAGIGLTRMSSVGSMAGGILFPVFYLYFSSDNPRPLKDRWPFAVFTLLVAGMVVVRHRANIRRILLGTETRIGARRAKGEVSDSKNATDSPRLSTPNQSLSGE